MTTHRVSSSHRRTLYASMGGESTTVRGQAGRTSPCRRAARSAPAVDRGRLGPQDGGPEAHPVPRLGPLPVAPSPLRAAEQDPVASGRGTTPGVGQGRAGMIGESVDALDRGQPRPPALHRRLAGDAAEAFEVVRHPVALPADDRTLGAQDHDVVDRRARSASAPPTQDGRPWSASSRRSAAGPDGGRPRPRPPPRPGHRTGPAATSRRRRPPPAGRRRAGATPSGDGGDRPRPARDARRRPRTPAGRRRQRGTAQSYLKASRMRPTTPPLGAATASPRSSANRR